MRAAVWRAPCDVAPEELDAPVAGPGDVLIRVEHCGICGSDLHSYAHGMNARPGQVLGHELAGTVLEAPGVAGVAAGDLVTVRPLIPCGRCDACRRGDVQVCEAGMRGNVGYGIRGGMAERMVLPGAVAGRTVFGLPPGVGTRAGALVEPLAVALHAVRVADPAPDGVAVVLGGGTIGLGVVRFLALRGVAAVVLVEPSARRRAAGLHQGADVVLDPDGDDVEAAVREATGSRGRTPGADVVLDCAGAAGTLASGVGLLRSRGRLVACAIFAGDVVLPANLVVGRELELCGALGYRDEFPDVLAELAAGRIDAEALVSHEFGLEDVGAAFAAALDREGSLKVLLAPGG